MNEGEVYFYLKKFLVDRGWEPLAGEPPGGSNNIRRVEIRDKNWKEIGSKGSYKVDLIFFKDKTLLLIEIKPKYSQSDVNKLNEILSERLDKLYDALKERCGLDKSQISKIIKCISVGVLNHSIPDDFLAFIVKGKDEVSVEYGRQCQTLTLLED